MIETKESGAISSFKYDDRGRIIEKKTTEDRFDYEYDDNNNLIKASNKKGTSYLTYTDFGEVSSITDINGNTLKYNYDKLGNLTDIYYPSGKRVSRKIDEFERIVEVNDDDDIISYQYDEESRLLSLSNSQSTTLYNYSDNHDLTHQKTISKKTNEVIEEVRYKYNKQGSITEIHQPLRDEKEEYVYDELNRVIQVLESKKGDQVKRSFEYDNRGNRIQEKIKTKDEVIDKKYIVNMNDQLLRVVDSKGTFIQYQYDKNGNVINKRYQNDFEEKYNYNAENILTSIHNSDDRTIKFEYDHFGNRSAREETFDLHSVITSNKPKKDDQNEDKLSLNQAKHA